MAGGVDLMIPPGTAVRPTRAMHTSADTNGIPLHEELLEDTVYYDRQGERVNIMNETPLDEDLLETKSKEEEEGEDEEWDGEGARGMAVGQWLVTDDQL
jgi:hypothetical protein